jgi:hypothetical protein
MVEDRVGPTRIAEILNREQVAPPQGATWTKSVVYALKRRLGWHTAKPLNARTHTDEEMKARMSALRSTGRTYQAIANILNEEGYTPLRGIKFTEGSVCRLLGGTRNREILTPRAFIQQYVESLSETPSLQKLAAVLEKNGYQTPRGNTHWWPAQVRELLAGHFDGHYQDENASCSS